MLKCGLWEKAALLQGADVWKLSCSFRQTLSCQREHLLTQIVSTPAVGQFLWIKINAFCNADPIPAKRNLTQTAAQSPIDIGAGLLTHSTDVGMHMQASEPQDKSHKLSQEQKLYVISLLLSKWLLLQPPHYSSLVFPFSCNLSRITPSHFCLLCPLH